MSSTPASIGAHGARQEPRSASDGRGPPRCDRLREVFQAWRADAGRHGAGRRPAASSTAGSRRPMAPSRSTWTAVFAASRCRWCAARSTACRFPAHAEIGWRARSRRQARGRRPVRRMDRTLRRRRQPCTVLDIKAIYHRNDPILLGVPPMAAARTRWRATARCCARPPSSRTDQRRRAGRAAGLVP